MNCRHCGKPIRGDDQFCQFCGGEVAPPSPPVQPATSRRRIRLGAVIVAGVVAMIVGICVTILVDVVGNSSQQPSAATHPPARATVGNEGLPRRFAPNPTAVPTHSGNSSGLPSIPDIVQRVSPSIVHITTASGTGSGFVVGADGTIITNAHVVEDYPLVSVRTHDRRNYEAIVVERDHKSDIAYLQLQGNFNVLPIAIGDSNSVRLGEEVIAIGFPLADKFTENPTITKGILSSRVNGLLQIDAALNPGNSGGPLLNTSGCVVGINTLVIRHAEGIPVEGFGFAIPINDVPYPMDNINQACTSPEAVASVGDNGAAMAMVPQLTITLTPTAINTPTPIPTRTLTPIPTPTVRPTPVPIPTAAPTVTPSPTPPTTLTPAVVQSSIAPTVFTGKVTQQGLSVPDGVVVSAWIEAREVVSTITHNSNYTLEINQPVEQNFVGKEVTFRVNQAIALERPIWNGAGGHVDLTIIFAVLPPTQILTPTPTPTPTPLAMKAYSNSKENWGYTIAAPKGWTANRSGNGMNVQSRDGKVVVQIFVKVVSDKLNQFRFAEEHIASVIKKYSTSSEFFDLSAPESYERGGQSRVLFPWRWQQDKDSCVMDMEDLIFRSRHFPHRPHGYIVRVGICDERLRSYLKVRKQIFDSFAESELPKKNR